MISKNTLTTELAAGMVTTPVVDHSPATVAWVVTVLLIALGMQMVRAFAAFVLMVLYDVFIRAGMDR